SKRWRVPGTGGTWVDAGPGGAAALGPADAAPLLGPDSVGFDNAGTGPVDLLNWVVAAGAADLGPPSLPPEWVVGDVRFSAPGAVSLPGRAALLRLRRLVLAPGARVAPPAGAILQFGVSAPASAAGPPEPSFVGTPTPAHPP